MRDSVGVEVDVEVEVEVEVEVDTCCSQRTIAADSAPSSCGSPSSPSNSSSQLCTEGWRSISVTCECSPFHAVIAFARSRDQHAPVGILYIGRGSLGRVRWRVVQNEFGHVGDEFDLTRAYDCLINPSVRWCGSPGLDSAGWQ